MKKFKFQLETLLRVTRRKKDDAERDFAAASRKVEEARDGLNPLLAEMQKGQQDYDALSQEGVRVSVGRLMTFNSFFAWKREQIEMQQNIILQMKAEKQKKLKKQQVISDNNETVTLPDESEDEEQIGE